MSGGGSVGGDAHRFRKERCVEGRCVREARQAGSEGKHGWRGNICGGGEANRLQKEMCVEGNMYEERKTGAVGVAGAEGQYEGEETGMTQARRGEVQVWRGELQVRRGEVHARREAQVWTAREDVERRGGPVGCTGCAGVQAKQ
eukprot:357428-Chlamydomonas_euryale.AAC.5